MASPQEMYVWVVRRLFPGSSQPDLDDICDAAFRATLVVGHLGWFRVDVQMQFPERTDTLELIEEVFTALSEDHGGMLPNELLESWSQNRRYAGNDYKVYTPQQRRALESFLERWKDGDRVNKVFRCLKVDQLNYVGERLTEERISQMMQFMWRWLRKRQTGGQYRGD